MTTPHVLRFEPHGPEGSGLAEWDPIDPGEIESGTPVQRGHIYHEIPEAGYMAGVWDCTANTLKFGPYPVHEFMFLLEGSVTIALADGSKTTVNAGEAFVIPKGLPCQWIQPDYVRKFFMILEDPDEAAASDVAKQSVILPQANGPEGGMAISDSGAASDFVGEPPEIKNHTYFEDPAKHMRVGVWETSASDRVMTRFGRNELMCILEGSVTITGKDGHSETFGPGDAAYVPNGAEFTWSNSETVRKFYTIYEP